jgi:glycosyltransferase involved in cell wall biosynthesis
MNIMIINHYAVPPEHCGGTRHHYLAKALVQCGHQVTIVAANFNHFTRRYIHDSNTIVHENNAGVEYTWLPVPAYTGNSLSRLWNMMMFSWQCLKNKRQLVENTPDIVIGSSPHLFAPLSGLRIARHYKVPFVLEIRDLWPDSLIDLGNMSPSHPLIMLLRKIEKHLYRHADHVITLLPGVAEYLKQYDINQEKITILPNFVDLNSITIAPEKQTSPDNAITAVYAGSHGTANNLDVVLDAAAQLQEQGCHEINIKLIGDGPHKAALQHKAQQLSLKNVTFLDSIPKNTIFEFLHQADVFLMLLKDSPVFRFGISPNKLFDYMAMSRPVIFAVNTPYNPIAQIGGGISIAPDDPNALANALKQCANDTAAVRMEMGRKGREYVAQYHDLPVLAERLEFTLQKLVKSKLVGNSH